MSTLSFLSDEMVSLPVGPPPPSSRPHTHRRPIVGRGHTTATDARERGQPRAELARLGFATSHDFALHMQLRATCARQRAMIHAGYPSAQVWHEISCLTLALAFLEDLFPWALSPVEQFYFDHMRAQVQPQARAFLTSLHTLSSEDFQQATWIYFYKTVVLHWLRLPTDQRAARPYDFDTFAAVATTSKTPPPAMVHTLVVILRRCEFSLNTYLEECLAHVTFASEAETTLLFNLAVIPAVWPFAVPHLSDRKDLRRFSTPWHIYKHDLGHTQYMNSHMVPYLRAHPDVLTWLAWYAHERDEPYRTLLGYFLFHNLHESFHFEQHPNFAFDLPERLLRQHLGFHPNGHPRFGYLEGIYLMHMLSPYLPEDQLEPLVDSRLYPIPGYPDFFEHFPANSLRVWKTPYRNDHNLHAAILWIAIVSRYVVNRQHVLPPMFTLTAEEDADAASPPSPTEVPDPYASFVASQKRKWEDVQDDGSSPDAAHS
jgi:hypothetical protein